MIGMPKKKFNGYAKLEMLFGYDPPAIYCPACGKSIFSEKGCAGCDHLIFAYLDVAGEFSYISPRYEKVIRKIDEDESVEDETEH
jgi:hypothetical protein